MAGRRCDRGQDSKCGQKNPSSCRTSWPDSPAWRRCNHRIEADRQRWLQRHEAKECPCRAPIRHPWRQLAPSDTCHRFWNGRQSEVASSKSINHKIRKDHECGRYTEETRLNFVHCADRQIPQNRSAFGLDAVNPNPTKS